VELIGTLLFDFVDEEGCPFNITIKQSLKSVSRSNNKMALNFRLRTYIRHLLVLDLFFILVAVRLAKSIQVLQSL
jgi:hypothetical protein